MTTPVWLPEIVVDEALARALIASQFPQVDSLKLERLGYGYDNTAFLAGDGYVFRFPRRAVAVELIEREFAVLPILAPALPVPIPVPELHGLPTGAYPWPFAGYRYLAGRTACSVDLRAEDRAALAPELGGFLRALHAIDPAPAVARGLTGDTIARLDHAKRFPLAKERLADLYAADIVAKPEPLLAFMAAHPPQPCADRRIVHGDFYARHVLLDASLHFCGAIDWGDVHLGDPALDLAIALTVLPPQAHAAFERAYGTISQESWDRAMFRAIYHSVLVAHYGAEENDPGMLRIGVDALGFIAEALRR